MVIRAKTDIKGDSDIKIFYNEDVSTEGRALKAQLKRVAQIAKEQDKNAKASGNKVTIKSRSYFWNQLSMIPEVVAQNLKHEKYIEDGIVFKGDNSIFSNFYPAPFTLLSSNIWNNTTNIVRPSSTMSPRLLIVSPECPTHDVLNLSGMALTVTLLG